MLNPASITTDKVLAQLLLQLGFVTQPGDYYRTPIQKSTPSRCIMAQENDLFSHVAIAVEEHLFVIYFFNELNQRFDYYTQLQGPVSAAHLREAILKASRWEGLTFS